MRLLGTLFLVVAGLCAVLPVIREAMPFRIAMPDRDVLPVVITLGLAGVVAVLAK